MNGTGSLIIGLVIAFIGGLLYSRRTSKADAQVLDLTNKIKQKQAEAAQKQHDADALTKEYQDALKAYDPNFYSGDDGDSGGKPSA